jgi:hypothetical protein
MPGSDLPPVLEPHKLSTSPSVLTTHTFGPERKEKEKKRPKETPTSDRKTKESQRTRSLEEEQVSDPLGKGNGSTHPTQKTCSRKEHKPPIQSSNNTKSSPCTHASTP